MKLRIKIPAILIALLFFLLAARIALPYWLKDYVNKTLDKIPDYDGQVSDIGVSLWRGAYVIYDVRLTKTSGKIPVPFFSSERVDLSVQWKSLLDGSFVGEIEFFKPQLNFVNASSKKQSQTTASNSWQQSVADLFPLKFNRFALTDGSIHYRDFESSPKVDVSLDNIYAEATNLTNSKKLSKTLVASLEGTALAEKQAPVKLSLQMDPYKSQPTFNLDASVENLDLLRLNDLLKAYGNFDVEKGGFSFYTEVASEAGKFKGYAKPIFKDVSVFSVKSDSSNPLKLIWEGIVSVILEIFTNHRHDQIAAKIPLSGKFESPEPDLWAAVTSTISNAFVSAISSNIDDSVSLKDLTKTTSK